MKPELLCPSGDLDSLKAALYAGCDAVYLGGTKYSARAYASNFTDEELKKSIDFVHLFNAKVYITINTILKNTEIIDAYNYAVNVWNLGVDALIVQDMGLVYLLKKYNPEIELHASTQMTIHNYEGAKYAHFTLGLKRLVLSRELSIGEIKSISKDFETEIFIHGALCISYSGKCLMSSLLTGRSGNRGRCSQNCRMKYKLLDSLDKVNAEGFLMSPKDLNTIDILNEIVDTNTASLKIEGRMKRKEYVFEVANQYRKKLDGFKTNEKNIAQLFNREGFNKSFMLGNDGKDMMAVNSPKNTGLILGKCNKGFIYLQENIRLGDGVGNKNNGFFVTKIIDSKNKEIKEAFIGQKVKIYPNKYKDNDILYKTNDNELIKNINSRLKELFPRKLPITIECNFNIDKNIELKVKYENIEITKYGDIVQKAQKAPISKDKLIDSLSKSGDTVFFVDDVLINSYEEGFIGIGKLNEVRRELLEELKNKIIEVNKNEKINLINIENEINLHNDQNLEISKNIEHRKNLENKVKFKVQNFAVVSKDEQVKIIENSDFIICFYPFYKNKEFINLKYVLDYDKLNKPYYLRLPEIIKEEFDVIIKFIEKLKNLKAIVSDNLGIFSYFKEKYEIIGDYKLNIVNSIAPLAFKGVNFFTISEELNGKEINDFINKDNKFIKLYGYDELMISEFCPVGAYCGGKSHNIACSEPCIEENYKLLDDKKESFPILTDIFCRSYIFNGKVKEIFDKRESLVRNGYSLFRLDFTSENENEVIEALNCYNDKTNIMNREITKGHYKRGIE